MEEQTRRVPARPPVRIEIGKRTPRTVQGGFLTDDQMAAASTRQSTFISEEQMGRFRVIADGDAPASRFRVIADGDASAQAADPYAAFPNAPRQAATPRINRSDALGVIQRVRAKYPQYGDMDDRTLAARLAAKYPEYADVAQAFADPQGDIFDQIGNEWDSISRPATEWDSISRAEVAGGPVPPVRDELAAGIQRFAQANPNIPVEVTDEPSPTAGMFAPQNLPAPTNAEALRHLAILRTPQPALPEVVPMRSPEQIERAASAAAVQAVPRPLRPLVGGLAQSGLTSASLLMRPLDALGVTDGAADAMQRDAASFTQGQADIGDSHLEQLATGAVRSVADVLTLGKLIPGGGKVGSGRVGAAATRLNEARGAIIGLTSKSINDAITEGRQAGLSGSELAGYATLQGGMEGLIMSAFQLAGFGGVENLAVSKSVVKGVVPFLKQLGVSSLQELPEEVLTTIGQQVHKQIAGVDPQAIDTLPQAIGDTVIQTLMTVGLAESVRHVASPAAPQSHANEPAAQEIASGLTGTTAGGDESAADISGVAVNPTQIVPIPNVAAAAEAPVANEIVAERPEIPADLIKRDLLKWGRDNGYDVAGLESKGRKIIMERLDEQRLQTAAQRVMGVQRAENVRAIAEQRQLPAEGHSWDAGQLRRFARENGYEVDERRVKIAVERGEKPRDAVRQQIEAQYALPKGEGPAGEVPQPTLPVAVERPSSPSPSLLSSSASPSSPSAVLPELPAYSRTWSHKQMKYWAVQNGYRVDGTDGLFSLRTSIAKQRSAAVKAARLQQLPAAPTVTPEPASTAEAVVLPEPPADSGSWPFAKKMRWAVENGYDVEGIEGRVKLNAAIAKQRTDARSASSRPDADRPEAKTPQQQERKTPRTTPTRITDPKTPEHRRIAELESQVDALDREVNTDKLTGGLNRRAFEATYQKLTQRADKTGRVFTVIIFDAANLKSVNDKLGQTKGDEYLKRAMETINQSIRGSSAERLGDASMNGFRYGGDEYAVTLPDTDEAGARVVRDRIEKVFGREKIAEGVSAFIVGDVVSYKPGSGESFDSIKDRGNELMRTRKAAMKSAAGEALTRSDAEAAIKRAAATAKIARASAKEATPIPGEETSRWLPRDLQDILTPIASRIRDISPRVFGRLIQYDLAAHRLAGHYKGGVHSFSTSVHDEFGKEGTPKHEALKLAWLNGDIEGIKQMLPERSRDSFTLAREIIKKLHKDQTDASVKVGYLENYLPRRVIDAKGLRESLGNDDKGIFDEAYARATSIKGVPLTAEERNQIASDVVAGYGPRKPGKYRSRSRP
ncbi:MAG: GGDEF domain-containing protein [Tepidisphaeraceae bacterium]